MTRGTEQRRRLAWTMVCVSGLAVGLELSGPAVALEPAEPEGAAAGENNMEAADADAGIEPRLRVVQGEAASAAQRKAREILSHEQFRHVLDEAPSFDSSEQLSVFISRLMKFVQSLGPEVQWSIVAVCILALLAIFAHVVILVRRVLIAASPEHASRTFELRDDPPEPDAARNAAEEAARRRDYPLALRHLHRYLRLELARRKILPYRESWTNLEYLGAVAQTGIPLEPMEAFTALCDRVFYGADGGSRDDYEASLAALALMFASAPGVRPQAVARGEGGG